MALEDGAVIERMDWYQPSPHRADATADLDQVAAPASLPLVSSLWEDHRATPARSPPCRAPPQDWKAHTKGRPDAGRLLHRRLVSVEKMA